ncbi:MAG: hypothetical protein V4510_05025 [bacterium]
MRTMLVSAAMLTTLLAVAACAPVASAGSPYLPRVVADPEHGTVCVIETPGADVGVAACVQAYDPDCLVLAVYDTIAGPYSVCVVPRP